jgi:hypothetical protein
VLPRAVAFDERRPGRCYCHDLALNVRNRSARRLGIHNGRTGRLSATSQGRTVEACASRRTTPDPPIGESLGAALADGS